MSVDTRTPRTPTGDRSSGYDDAPALSMVKVPSDPAQVIVNHASFRVQLGASTRAQSPRIARHLSATEDTARFPVVGTAGRSPGTPPAGRRRAPVVWSGKSAPDDTGAHRLLQAVRNAGATQVIPHVTETGGYDVQGGRYNADLTVETVETPILGSQRSYVDPVAPVGDGDGDGTRLLPAMRGAGSSDSRRRISV